MNLNLKLSLSYYREIANINEKHQVYLVQHIETQQIFVKKILDVYNLDVYKYLYTNVILGLPHIYELYLNQNKLILIEEYISGSTLENLLETKGSFSEEEIIDYTIQLCEILTALHNCKPPIIHRDIKPSNVILTPSGQIILLDLNAAKHMDNAKSADTTLLGTRGYAAPEQYGFGSSNIQTDIYAIGMLMNTQLMGKFAPVQPQNGNLSSIISKCTQLNPSDRYKSIKDLKHSLLNLKNRNPINNINRHKGLVSYLPPGYRNFKFTNMLLATFGYFFIFWLGFSLEIKDTSPVELVVLRFLCVAMFLSVVLCSCNYLNIQSLVPLCRKRNILFKISGVILLDIIFLFSIFFLMIIASIIIP